MRFNIGKYEVEIMESGGIERYKIFLKGREVYQEYSEPLPLRKKVLSARRMIKNYENRISMIEAANM